MEHGLQYGVSELGYIRIVYCRNAIQIKDVEKIVVLSVYITTYSELVALCARREEGEREREREREIEREREREREE